MPLVTGRMIDRLIAAYDPDEGRLIVLPTHQGKPGNPILWDRRFFPEILALTGDVGARFLLGAAHGGGRRGRDRRPTRCCAISTRWRAWPTCRSGCGLRLCSKARGSAPGPR